MSDPLMGCVTIVCAQVAMIMVTMVSGVFRSRYTLIAWFAVSLVPLLSPAVAFVMYAVPAIRKEWHKLGEYDKAEKKLEEKRKNG